MGTNTVSVGYWKDWTSYQMLIIIFWRIGNLYHKRKEKIKHEIVDIYHSHNGTDGYRTVHAYLLRKGYSISCVTVHKYMNTGLQLFSITRKRKALVRLDIRMIMLLWNVITILSRMNWLIIITIILRKNYIHPLKNLRMFITITNGPHSYNNYKTPFEARYGA